jgi:anti-sigma B factor antagonist
VFEIQLRDGILFLSGRLDASKVADAEKVLDTLTQSTTVDLSELDYISSAGIGAFLKVQKRLHASGQGLRLVHPRPRVRDIFHFAGLEHVFQME